LIIAKTHTHSHICGQTSINWGRNLVKELVSGGQPVAPIEVV